MACEVKIIEDSINPYNGIRLTTIQLRYWRSIHAEFMTHRVFSRNASSSRAIPVKTMLKQVWNDPAGPIHWGANQSGMQANTQVSGLKLKLAKLLWKHSGRVACVFAWFMTKIGLHKQVANRILEPWQYISVIVTSTEWDNFFELRNHPDAQPEIQELACEMKLAMDSSTPVETRYHVPYITEQDKEWASKELPDGSTDDVWRLLMKLSTARCARVSYLTHDGKKPSVKNDMELYWRLVGSRPIHASPTEHQASAFDTNAYIRNFKSWMQHRCSVELDINLSEKNK